MQEPVPGEAAWAEAIGLFEGVREIGRGGEPGLQGDSRQSRFGTVQHVEDGRFQPQPSNERMQRLADDRPEEAMEMEWREVGQSRQFGNRQRLRQVLLDMVRR